MILDFMIYHDVTNPQEIYTYSAVPLLKVMSEFTVAEVCRKGNMIAEKNPNGKYVNAIFSMETKNTLGISKIGTQNRFSLIIYQERQIFSFSEQISHCIMQ